MRPTLLHQSLAVLLLIGIFISILPATSSAQVTTCATAIGGVLGSIAGVLGLGSSVIRGGAGLAEALGGSLGDFAGSIGGLAALAGGLTVPVFDARNFGVNANTSFQSTVTAGMTSGLMQKSCMDAITTALLKTAIALVRDTVIRWIATGNFGAPVFSTSYRIDAARIAENASRIFLSRLTSLNFCAGFGIPNPANFTFSFNLWSQCTLPPGLAQNYTDALLRLHNSPGSLSFEEWLALNDPQNNRIYQYVFALDEKARQEAAAVNAFDEEYQAGKGFLCIRNSSGRCTTPGSAVAELVMQSQIVSPIRQTDVADDVQTAIAAIVNTAVQTLINRGLTSVFGP